MNIDRIIEIASQQMANHPRPCRETGYLFNHGLRTGKLAVRLAREIDQALSVELEILLVAGLFHDVGKEFKPHNDHGAEIVAKLLKDECNPQELTAIINIVRAHPLRDKPNVYPTAAKIVQDADMIDHFGAQGVWLAFHDAAGLSPKQMLACYRKERTPESIASTREKLNFPIALAEFDRRVELERAFFSRFEQEIDPG